jgi:prophage tail gpP-like protein
LDKKLEIALRLIQARETAKQIAKEIAKPITVTITPEVKVKHLVKQSIPIDIRNKSVKGTLKVLDIRDRGELDEIMISADRDDYMVTLIVDGNMMINAEKWSVLKNLYAGLTKFSAYQDEDTKKYVLHLSGISFLSNLRLDLDSRDNPVTYDRIYGQYTLLKEKD